MSIEAARDYLETVAKIEALWDAAEEAGDKDQLNTLIMSAEIYERQHSMAGLQLATVSQIDRYGPLTPVDHLEDLGEPFVLCGFVGWRSAAAAIRACNLLMVGDVRATMFWMNHKLSWSAFTPLQLAEQGDECLQMILDHIGRIEAGVFY